MRIKDTQGTDSDWIKALVGERFLRRLAVQELLIAVIVGSLRTS